VNPQSWMAHSNLGMVLANRSPDEAIAHCRTAVALDPRSWVARNNLSALLASRDPDEAIAQCRAALELDPYDAEAYNNMGSALIYKGDRTAALEAFKKASQLAPDNLIILDNYHRTADGGFATTRNAE
jgi:Flp pilus assembly protein TadD